MLCTKNGTRTNWLSRHNYIGRANGYNWQLAEELLSSIGSYRSKWERGEDTHTHTHSRRVHTHTHSVCTSVDKRQINKPTHNHIDRQAYAHKLVHTSTQGVHAMAQRQPDPPKIGCHDNRQVQKFKYSMLHLSCD